MRIVLLGATKGIGKEVARRLAERGDTLVLLGRSAESLTAIAADLNVRGAASTTTLPCDLADAASHGPALDAAWAALGHVDGVVVTAGLFGTQEQLESDPALLAAMLDVNLTKTILFCEAARVRLLDQGGGRLVVFSSVAGDRGRKTVGLYGATKAGLSHYLDALDHRFRSSGLLTTCVKPGFVRTGMTAGLKEPPFAANPGDVAEITVRALDRGTPQVYAPGIWRLVMLVIRHLPRFVMRRVGF